eukprot:3327211-Prymnesium_polylepis.1
MGRETFGSTEWGGTGSGHTATQHAIAKVRRATCILFRFLTRVSYKNRASVRFVTYTFWHVPRVSMASRDEGSHAST